MSRYAIVFPGQGSQFVGMGADLCAALPGARARYEQADDILGFSLSGLCFEGPEETLGDTANTQPAIYATTMILWEALAERLNGGSARIALAAGHSLGEYAALTAAGALDFEQGLCLVRERGLAMREAGECAPGGMAAIIGLSDEAVHEIMAQVQAEGLHAWVANYNSPGQVVIAGCAQGLERAVALAHERRAKRAIPLAVSVACHTPLMGAAAERLGAALAETEIRTPWAPVVSNVTATPLSEPEEIRAALLRQLSAPVRWVESVQAMSTAGVTTMLEVGPKSVVAGLIRRIDGQINVAAITDAASLEGVAETLAEAVPA
jgi:[acyl-carrier-protein] S-malonyltransferase